MQLRRTLTEAAVGLGVVTLIACAALVVFTTMLRRNVDDVQRSQEMARLTSRLAHQAFRHEIETSPMGRSAGPSPSWRRSSSVTGVRRPRATARACRPT